MGVWLYTVGVKRLREQDLGSLLRNWLVQAASYRRQ